MVLMGRDTWRGLFDWLRSDALADGRLTGRDLAIVTITDDPDEAVEALSAARPQGPPR
jgi:hypothetical protein